ncbi:MAG: ATP-grasp domain-containing protein [Bacteroidales bacterium]|nr:ATP-grasp domain-containing protein [Bacteroidales bacterium]
MKKNILVFPCGSEIGLDIYSSVKYSTHFHLIGGSSIEDHGAFVYDEYIQSIPFVTDTDFIPAIRKIVVEKRIDAIYPAMDYVISELKSHENEIGCSIISSPEETTKVCLSKAKTYARLKDVVRVPKLFKPDEVNSFPVFVKPDIGYGSKGTALVSTESQLQSLLSSRSDLLILEYLPGEEFTVDCFTDRKGRLLYSAARGRYRIKDGISVNTSFVNEQDEFRKFATSINSALAFRGAWFFQVKKDGKGELCLLEVASRLGGSSLLSRAKGVNLALLSLFDAFDMDVSLQVNEGYQVTLDRALENKYRCKGLDFNTVYVDFDDCLILNKKTVNVELISFLFKCRNENKRLILLSKHHGDLMQELQHFKVDTLFDEIIHIQDHEEKADHIQEMNSLFIDDSFSEREKVLVQHGIPVFGPEMIDVFL